MQGHATVDRPRDHVVNLYDDDADVVIDASRFIAGGLTVGEAAVIVATSAHHAAFEVELWRLQVDVDAVHAAGRLHLLDAESTLTAITVDGAPDPARFRSVMADS